MQSYRMAIDIGGTFTDICVMDEASGAIRVAKVASTADPIDGALSGVKQVGIDLRDVMLISHGTTIATNALLTRNLPRAAMVTTRGFRDVIEIRRGTKEDLWDAYDDPPRPYIKRRDRLQVTERIDYAGDIVTPLDEADARRVARILRKRNVKAIAVCFINSYANPVHERRMKEILEAEIPGVEVSASSLVLPEIFEHERFSTTVVNAMLSPVVGAYADRFSEGLAARGYGSDLLLLHSGGGVMTTRTATQFAARLAGSGIAAGAIASRHIAKLCGYENAIGVDMGGTSCDVSMVYAGEAIVTKDWYIEHGYPICFPSIEVRTIGAGGGSLAWIDDAGSLHNGPQSAGSDPGPACYGRGQTAPTNTDANLLLGRLGSELVGGALQLHPAAAEAAIREHVGERLGLEPMQAALAIVSVANANMADAVRLISISRGYDPRDFVLVAFGGAGALHGAALAKELSIPTVVVPPNPGVTSALGCLLVDIRHDLATTYLVATDDADPQQIETEFAKLEAEARERLAAEGIADDQMQLQRGIDMRYLGQWRSLAVPVGAPLGSIEDAVKAFHDGHQREYNYRRDQAAVEIYRLNLTAVGLTSKAKLARHAGGNGRLENRATRQVLFDDSDQPVETPIYWRDDLDAGARIVGPAVIEQLDSTTVVPPGVPAEVDPWMNIRLYVSQASR